MENHVKSLDTWKKKNMVNLIFYSDQFKFKVVKIYAFFGQFFGPWCCVKNYFYQLVDKSV